MCASNATKRIKGKEVDFTLFVGIITIVLAAVGVSHDVTLGRKSDPAETSNTVLQSASPTMGPVQALTSDRFIKVVTLK